MATKIQTNYLKGIAVPGYRINGASIAFLLLPARHMTFSDLNIQKTNLILVIWLDIHK